MKVFALKFSLTVFLLGTLLVMPVLTFAQEFCEITPGVKVPCPLGTSDTPAGQESLGGLALDIIQILLLIVGSIAVLFLIIGGFRYVTAAGNEEQTEAAKKTITHSILGLIVVILSFVIVRVITNALIFGTPF